MIGAFYRTVFFVAVLLFVSEGADNLIFAVTPAVKKHHQPTNPVKKLQKLLGTAYREDGAQDFAGNYVTFSSPTTTFKTPGLNCSGFVLSACRLLFKQNITIQAVIQDRLKDSGSRSRQGKDWDFGWDLIFNLTEGHPRRIMTISGYQPFVGSGNTLKGFALNDREAWRHLIPRIKSQHLYLATISKHVPQKKSQRIYYHVALMVRDHKRVWFYHATKNNHTHRLNLSSERGLALLQGQFYASPRPTSKHILIVEVSL